MIVFTCNIANAETKLVNALDRNYAFLLINLNLILTITIQILSQYILNTL